MSYLDLDFARIPLSAYVSVYLYILCVATHMNGSILRTKYNALAKHMANASASDACAPRSSAEL